MSRLIPGQAGEPLPTGEDVIRLLRVSRDGIASETSFTLSSKDEVSPLASISVYVHDLTTPREALALMESEQAASYEKYAFLPVDKVRELRPSPESPNVPSLDVVWDPLIISSGVADTRPGAAGHAGITGLRRPAGLADAKLFYKSLRSQLTDLANQRLFPFAPSPEGTSSTADSLEHPQATGSTDTT